LGGFYFLQFPTTSSIPPSHKPHPINQTRQFIPANFVPIHPKPTPQNPQPKIKLTKPANL
jgi:hypothetical protein